MAGEICGGRLAVQHAATATVRSVAILASQTFGLSVQVLLIFGFICSYLVLFAISSVSQPFSSLLREVFILSSRIYEYNII